MKAKFEIGDKVKFSQRVPAQTLEEYSRQRTRTIVAVGYSPEHQCSSYELGTNHGTHTSGAEGMFLRSYMLTLVAGQRKVGRPRKQRCYCKRERRLRKVIRTFLEQSGFDVKPEVKLGRRIADFVASQDGYSIAIELKWKDWQYALKQAIAYMPFVSDVYVALPHNTAPKLILESFLRQNIGLIRANWKTNKIILIAYPNPAARTKLPTASLNQRCGVLTPFQHPDYLAPIKMPCSNIV